MPVYKYNGKTYDIPEDVVSDFEKDMPGATLAYQVDDKVYDIPVSEKQGFLETYPTASLYAEEPAKPAMSPKEELDAFYQENGTFMDDYEKRDSLDQQDTARNAMVNEGFSFFKPKSRVSDEERTRYKELAAQRKALEKAWYTSDEYLSQQEKAAGELAQIQKEITNERKVFSAQNPYREMPAIPAGGVYVPTTGNPAADHEHKMFEIADRIMSETIKLHNAPNKYGSQSGLRNMGVGAKDKITDPAFLTMGLSKITDDLGVRDVLAKIQKERGNLNDLSEDAIDGILTTAEKAVLKAWALNAQEQLARQGNLSLGYQAGQSATESLEYMAEFALTGGVGKLASEGVEGMAKWLAKNAYKMGGLADDAAEVAVREIGEKMAKSTVGKYGVGLAKSLAETAGKTMVMPSTYKNIAEKATEIQEDENGNRHLVELNDAFAEGYVDSFIENLSEGGRVNALGELVGDVAGKIPVYKKLVDKFSKTKASELLTMLNSTGVMNTLRAGGWHGFGEEYLEEWYGNALRTLTGVDKEALKDFATVDNQIVTITSFLPMTIFGGTVSTAQVLSANKDLEKKAAALKSALMERGYDEAQANNMIDMMRGAAPAEVSETLTPIVNSVANRNANEAAALMKPVGEFAAAVQRWQSFNTKYNYQEQEQRDGLRAQMEENLGQFWQQDENGRQTVQRGVNEKGEVVYMLGKPSVEDVEAGVTSEVAAVTSDGRKVFVNPSEYQLEDELEMNTFLGNEIMAEKGNQEQARMIEEKEAKIAAIRETAVPGTAVNIGTAEAPMQAIVLQKNPDGVIVNTPDGQTRQMTYEEFGNYVGVNAVPMTDAQIDEQEADALSADRSQREAALDQEYDNDAEAIEELAEAEQEIEQSIEAVTPLPTKADGSVDQTALWNKDPERWAQWNDEQRQDGGANTLAYVNGAIAKEQDKIAELQAAYAAESDFDARDAIEKELTNVRERILRLAAIQQSYAAQAEAAAPPVAEAEQVAPRVVAQASEQEMEQVDTQYDGILKQTRIKEERVRILQEYLDKISEGSLQAFVLTSDNYADVMRREGCSEGVIAVVGMHLEAGENIGGFTSGGKLFLMEDGLPSIEEARITYIHERQHVFNTKNPAFVKAVASIADKQMLLSWLSTFVGPRGLNPYKSLSAEQLADEVVARCMEIAYTTKEFSVDLQSRGIPSEVISIITDIDNEQRKDQNLLNSRRGTRRDTYADVSGTGSLREDGRNIEQISRGVLEQETTRPSSIGEERVGSRSAGEGAEVISEEQLNAPNSGEAQQITAADGEVIADTNGKGGVRFSIRTWNEGGRDYLAAWLANDTTLTEEEKADILARMDEFYKNALLYSDSYVPFGTWSDAEVRYDNEGNPLMSVVKANGDYAMNLDFSLVCKKRRPLNRLLRTLINRNAFGSYDLKEREIAEINWILQEHGFEVACALCFVDSKRYRVAGVADVFAKLWNNLVTSLAPKGVEIAHFNYNNNPNVAPVENGLDTLPDDQLDWKKLDKAIANFKKGSVEYKVAQYLREHPEARKLVDATDFIEAEGFEAVKEANPDLLKFYNMKKGTGGPKASFGDVQYLNDILRSGKKFDAEKAYAVGGVRLQSFSDFVPHMYFDYMQLFAELAAKQLPVHAYTKEPLFAKIFGLTGAKINLSLVPAVVEGGMAPGLDAEGNYAWADPVVDAESSVIQQGQTFPYNEAMAIQSAEGYSKNCGAIAVGISDAHIEKMLDDPNIPFIIPYHKSSLNAIVARMTNIDQYKDYTNVQNTRKASGSKLDKGTKDFNFNEYLHGLGESGTPQMAAQAYLDWCRDNKFIPKFSQFAYHPNYYKLLQDFNTIDLTTGEYAPQGAVSMTFPTEQNAFGNVETLIDQGLQEDAALEEKMENEIDGIADQVVARLEEIAKEPKMSDKQRAKKMSELADERMAKIKKQSGVIDLVEEAQKAVAREGKLALRVISQEKYDEAEQKVAELVGTRYFKRVEGEYEIGKLASSFAELADIINVMKDNRKYVSVGTSLLGFFANNPEMHFPMLLSEKGNKEALTRLEEELAKVNDIYALLFIKDAWRVQKDTLSQYGLGVSKSGTTKFNKAIEKRIENIMAQKAGGTAFDFKKQESSLDEIDAVFKQLNNDPELAFLHDRVMSVARTLGVKVSFAGKRGNTSGESLGDKVSYDYKYFNSPAVSNQGKCHVITHELIHSITTYAIYLRSKRPDMLKEGMLEAVDILHDVYNQIARDPAFKGEYGVTDVYEMVAELSNAQFRDKLKEKNLFQRILDALKKLLGIDTVKEDSAYQVLSDTLDYIIDNYDEAAFDAYALYASKNRSYGRMMIQENTLVPGHKKGQPMLSDAEMMADVSFRITKNTKATIEGWCDKAGLEADAKNTFVEYVDETFGDTTEQLCAAKWYLNGAINLPNEDTYKVKDAVKVAKKNKVDALLYDSPMDIIYQFGKPSEKQKPIDPDSVSTLKNKKEVPGTDITIYDVEEGEESRQNMREIINTHYGKNASPWCLLQGNEFGELTPEAKERWDFYSAYPKQVAFKGGRLLAFSANSTKKETWWDRLDKPYEGVPVMEKLNDKLNRRATSVINPKTGEKIRIADVHSKTEKDGYTIIRNWDGIDGPMLSAQKRKEDALIAQFNRYTEEDFATNLQYWFAGRPNGIDQVYTQEKTISFSPNGALETYNVEGYRLAYNRYGRATWLITTKTPVIQEYGFNRKGKLVSFFSGTELIYDRKRLSEVEVPEGYKALVGRSPKSFMAEAEQLIIEAGLAEAYEDSKSEVRFRITPEMESIREKAKKDGTFMKAPNGQPTNLTEEQWLMVRTKGFKEWFGDWINDPENASKVVDENGEPKVVYHGSNWRPILEEPGKATFRMRSGLMGRGAYFTDNFTTAADYAREKYEWENYKEVDEDFVSDNGYITEAFLNIRNEDNIREYYGEIYYLATDPSQIKSATDNNGDFNPNNNDIRFRVRQEGESAMDFHQSVVDEFSSRFNPVAEIQVFPVNEEAAKRFEYTLEELQDTYGDYDKENDLISIFAHEDVTNSIDVESTIFHESIHKNQAHFGGFTKIGDWMLDMAETNDVFAEYREIVRENYTEDKHSEEMLCLMLGDIMALRKAFEFMAMMPEDIQVICEDLLNQLDYDKSREKTARVLRLVEGRSDSSTTIPAKRKASKGSWRKTKAEGALTAEERRIIGEYFPEFNKSEDVRMRVNSQGNELTEGQTEFFANSKAVDKDGNLLVLYHGTPRAGFTEFKSGWFTTSKEDAISYSGDRKGRLFDPNEKYEPETLTAGDFRLGYMTFDSEEDRAAFLERFPYADEVMSEREYEDARMGAEDEEYDALTARRKEFAEVWNAYREYERERFVDTPIADLIANPEAYTEEDLMRAMLEYDSNASLDSLDDMSAEERKDALVSALQTANEETEGGILDMVIPTRVPRNGEGLKHNDLGNRTYEVYANVENPYEIDANGKGSEFESGDIYKAVEEALADEQYDGVIVRNWRVGRTQQLGDVVVPKDGSQIKLTSNESPTEGSDIRFRTSLELDEEFGDAWRNQQNEDGRHSTQVANTKSTYEKIGHYLEDAGMKGASILDASSGLGLGTQALREMGFQVDDVEPFPSENREAPTFSSYADIDGKYDVVISNAVLNVIPDDWRADVLHQMADAVKEGGKMIINTRPASNIAQQGVEGKTRITLDSPSEILVKRGDRIAAYQKGFTSEELAEWIKSELGEGWRVEKATKKNSGISGEGTAVVIKEGDNVSFRTTGTPTDEVVTNGLQLTPAQTAEVAANIFAALPEESRKKITEGLNGNVLGLKDAILQIPTSLASKESWNEEDKQMAAVVAEEMTKMAGEMTRPFSAEEGLWLLYNNLNKGTDLISQASRALVQRNLGFDAETLAKQEQAKEDVRFRTVGDATSNAQASLYNRGAVNAMTRLKESYVDMNASVEELIKAIEKRTGKEAQGFENILLALNQQSSKGLAAMESYTQKFLNPMFDEIRKIMDETKMKYEDVVRYVILKHGLERNKKLAQRDARAHYQEIYDDIISKITGMTAAQKRTYLTNAQLKEGDAKAELATLQAVDMSAMTDEEKREHKKKLAAARKAVEEAEEYLKRAQKIASLSEQEAQDELDKIFEKIENGTDSVFKEMRENDYSGISSMFYDQLGVDRKNFSTEEQYQAALMEAKKDRYSSLKDIEAAAEAEVKSFEGKTDTKELWKRINAATKETLRQQYEANMISKDQYLNLRDMFEYYVPLRGFKDNTAEDMYTYYRKPNSTGYTKPILGAEGRKTEAESPFGWIAAMAGSAIASNVKNEAKLALYYFVSNRPENGIATISKTWFVHTAGDVDERGKKIFRPAYPPFSEDLSSAEAKAQYEIWQANMKELQKQGQAYEAGQRLNLGNAVVNISDANKPEHIVNVKVGGKDYTIIINGNPRAAQAINGDLNIEGTAQDYSAHFGPVLRWMSSVNTSYNPEFWITNMMRDMAFTMMAVNIKEDPAYRRKFSKNYRKAFKVVSLVAKNEKGTIGDSYLEQQYKDFVKYGGVTGYTQIKDSETWEQEIENYLSSNDPKSVKNGKVMRGMKSAFHAAHRFGESLEQVSRFAAFLTARETGKSINEAINDAKEITVNFNRKGSGKMITLEEAKYLTGKNGQPLTKPQQWMVVGLSSIAPLGRRFIMFFNAAIQGLNATYKLMKKNPKRFTGWALGYAAVGMMNAVLHAMLDDDDDYLDIPQYERRNSLMIGGNGAYFKWALPQEARAFYALGDLAVETVMGRNPHQNVLGEALKIGTEILPVNPSEGWKAFIPSVAIPAIELMLNEDYKGAPIYNEQKWLSEEEKERTAKWSSAYQGTGWTYVKISQGLNFITGGDKHDAGWINLQPEKLEHLVQSAFGGTIRTADKFINTISAALDPEEPMTIRQTPFLNRFLTINDERFKNVHVNDVFDYYEAEAEHALTLEKKYTKDRDMEALVELRGRDEYQWAKIYGRYKKPLKAIQDKIKVADGTAEKKELMKQQDELKKRMIKEISEL